MAYFRKRGKRWVAEVRRKGYAPIVKTFPNKAMAELWATDTENKMLFGIYADIRQAEKLTLADALDRYADEVTPQKKGAKRELIRINYWKKQALAVRPFSSIKPADIATWRDSRLSSGAKPNTVRLDLALISHVYTIAIKEWGLPVDNPCEKIRKPSAGNGRDKRMSVEQEQAILEQAKMIHAELPAWIILAVESGMRRGELASIRREWINGKVCRLPDTKNGSVRHVPLSPRALQTIEELPELESGKLLSLNPDYVTRIFPACAVLAGVDGLRFHDLRHEATSRIFERGFNTMEVAAITGHKTLAMLQRYTHLSAESLADRL